MFNFPGLRTEENILFFIRKQWTAYIRVVLKLVLNLAIVFLLSYFIVDKFPHDSISYFLLIQAILFYIMGIWWSTFNGWLDEELDTFVITTERIIDTTQSALISIEIASADLDQVQDVRGKVAGFFGGLFHYGNLQVQTAGAKILFQMDHVENPEKYIDEIVERKNSYLAQKNSKSQVPTPEI